MNTNNISTDNKHKETQLIDTILHNNGYSSQAFMRNKTQVTKKTTNTITQQKWITFRYVGSQTRTITKLFKNTNLWVEYKTNNTIQNYLQPKNKDPDKFKHCGIYEIKFNSCQLKYIGQTGRNFRTRYREHIQAIHSNKTTSKYAQHILDTGHAFDTLENTLNVKKGPHMNSLERFYIYRLSRNNLHLNDTYADIYNPIN
jgi:hypothetical protein